MVDYSGEVTLPLFFTGAIMDRAEQVEIINVELSQVMEKWASEGYSPMAMAAVFTVMGLQIYRTCMNDEDFNNMMDNISASRSMIKSFDLEEAKLALKRSLN